MKKLVVLALGLILSLFVCGVSFAQDRPPVFTFPNGLGVINSGSSGHTAAACLFIKTGFSSEPAGKSGITDLLCSSVLSSNPVSSSVPPSLRIEQMGGKVTADVEAGYTCFTLVSPVYSFSDALQALVEMVSGSNLSDTAVQAEKGALIARSLAQEGTEEKMFHALFPAGVPGDIAKISTADLMAWCRERFTPDGSLLSIRGPFSGDEAIRMACAFRGWKGSGKAAHGLVEGPSMFKPDEMVELESKSGDAGALFVFRFPSPEDPEYCAALTARAILSGGTCSKVCECLRGDKPEACRLGSSLHWESGCPVMTVYTVTDAARIDGAVKGIKDSVRAVEEGKFSPEELERGKAFASGQAEFLTDSAEGAARYAGLYEISGAGPYSGEMLKKQFAKVGREDVVKAADKYLSGNALVIIRPWKEQ